MFTFQPVISLNYCTFHSTEQLLCECCPTPFNKPTWHITALKYLQLHTVWLPVVKSSFNINIHWTAAQQSPTQANLSDFPCVSQAVVPVEKRCLVWNKDSVWRLPCMFPISQWSPLIYSQPLGQELTAVQTLLVSKEYGTISSPVMLTLMDEQRCKI